MTLGAFSASEATTPTMPSAPSARPSWLRRVALCLPALLTLIVSAAISARSSLWRDEFATIQFASLGSSDLLAAVRHVDLIMSPYYGFMHLLSSSGVTGTGFRIPSLLAAAGTVAIATALGMRWWGTTPALVTGFALGFNPMFIQLAATARPYALATFLAMGSTLLLDGARRSNKKTTWALYALCLAAAGFLQTFAVLVVIAQAVLCLRSPRKVKLAFVICVLAVAVTMTPLVAASQAQAQQVSWIPRPDLVRAAGTLFNVLAYQLDQHIGITDLVIAAGFAAAILVSCMRLRTLDRVQRRDAAEQLGFSLALFAGPWLVLLAASLTAFPILTSHYLCASTIGMAMIFGIAASAISKSADQTARELRRWRGVTAGVLAAALIVGLGPLIAHLLSEKADRDDFPTLAQEIHNRATRGDVLAISQSYSESGFATGIAHNLHDDAYYSVLLSRLKNGEQPDLDIRLLASVQPYATIELQQADNTRRVWLVRLTGSPLTDHASRQLAEMGCRPERSSIVGTYGQDRLEVLECGVTDK